METNEKPIKKKMGFWEQANRATAAGWPMLSLTLMFVPFLILGKIAHAGPRRFIISCIILAIAGFIMFSVAKFSLFRQGRWLTFGGSLMTRRNRILYGLGYTLIICSACMALVIAFISN